jgi:hypothetical protein
MKTAVGNQLVEASGTVSALFKGLVGKFLQRLLDLATLGTFIFVKGHSLNLQQYLSGIIALR